MINIKDSFIDDDLILRQLQTASAPDHSRIDEILAKSEEMHGLAADEVLELLMIQEPEQLQRLFNSAKKVRNEIYGKRLVLFAPLYVSNLCNNECLYCAFRRSNKGLVRKVLTQEEINREVEILLSQGHKRLLLVAGEAYPRQGLQYIFDSIETIYASRHGAANIRRVNVNIAPLSVEDFKKLKSYEIGTYQIFQETYEPRVYQNLHTQGRKRDYVWRLNAMDRAFEAGFQDVGVGVLFGLADWRYEILALLQHIAHLEIRFGIGPHTISVPRLEPAMGSEISQHAPHPVDDLNFKRIISVLRLAVPYTGIILSTRESAQTRREAFDLGISQISAGSRTNPGGYNDEVDSQNSAGRESQFSLGDTRNMHEVIKEMVAHQYIPSFCTGCYRLGRVGKDFMDLAKPGLIKQYCLPNAMLSFREYLRDFADSKLRDSGEKLIQDLLQAPDIKPGVMHATMKKLDAIDNGASDAFF